MAALEKFFAEDIEATFSRDPEVLTELWTDDGVPLQQGARADIGKAAIRASNERRKAARPDMRLLSYVPEKKDVTIAAERALYWEYFTATYAASPGGEEKPIHARVLAVLRKQADGS